MKSGDTGRAGGDSAWPLRLSPVRLLILIAFLVFAAEAVIMLILSAFPPFSPVVQAIVDAGTLLLFLSPLYFIVYIPLRKEYLSHLNTDQEIRRLSRETIRALERERSRFVQDIHDDCGQIVTALGFGIDILRYTVPPDREDLQGQCRQLHEFVGQLGDKLRNLSTRLRPALLETCGILPALEWYVRQIQEQQSGLAIQLDASGCDARFNPELETAIFRLCQEGLTNILRHSGAKQAAIRLRGTPAGIGLTIEDDGRGFAMDTSQRPTGLGLVAMRERVAAFDGTFEIESAPGRGSVLRAFLPLVESSV